MLKIRNINVKIELHMYKLNKILRLKDGYEI